MVVRFCHLDVCSWPYMHSLVCTRHAHPTSTPTSSSSPPPHPPTPQHSVREFEVIDVFPYGVTVSWEKDGELVTSPLFERGCAVPSAKMLTFFRAQPFSVTVQYAEDAPLPEGFDRRIGTFEIGPIKLAPGQVCRDVGVGGWYVCVCCVVIVLDDHCVTLVYVCNYCVQTCVIITSTHTVCAGVPLPTHAPSPLSSSTGKSQTQGQGQTQPALYCHIGKCATN